jgi:hypothetical protein
MNLNSHSLNEFTELVKFMSIQWNELKKALFEGTIDYTDIDGLKQFTFFKVFDDVFRNTSAFFAAPLFKYKYIYRAVNELSCNYERMLPKLEFAKEHNRMNPAGKVFLYAGVENLGYRDCTRNIIKTCIHEIRAPKESKVTVCRFKPTKMGKSQFVVNLCGDNNLPNEQDELHEYLYIKYKPYMLRGEDFYKESCKR